MEREDQGRAHRESARSGDADDGEGVGEGAEVDNAVPRRRQLVRGLLLRLGRLGLLELGASLGLVLLVLDLESRVLLGHRVKNRTTGRLSKSLCGVCLVHSQISHFRQKSPVIAGVTVVRSGRPLSLTKLGV